MNLKDYKDVEDFLIDNTFQAYCAESNEQCVRYWENYAMAHPDRQETMQRAKRLYHILAGHKKPMQQQLTSLKGRIAEEEQERKDKLTIRWPRIFQVAAACTLIGFGYLWYTQRQGEPVQEERLMSTNIITYQTKKGEKKEFELLDGTRVVLNSDSRLEVEDAFNDVDRHVNLVGEAFFEVAKDKSKPFFLHTNDFDIRVLGTSFNVKSYPDELLSEALLVEGVIEMKSKGENENSIIVKPNQKVTIYRQAVEDKPKVDLGKKQTVKIALKEIAIQDVAEHKEEELTPDIAWKENRLALVDQDFASLKRILERWYDVDIELDGSKIQHYRFTATFSKESIEQVLNALQKVQPFKYERYGRKITIYEK